MRAVIAILLVCAACTSRDVELFPEDASANADAEIYADVPESDAGMIEDAAVPDVAVFPDVPVFPDAEPAEAGPSCVCRLLSCRTDECEAMVGPGSVCDNNVCTGATGSCRTDRDCNSGLTCTIDERSETPCP